MPRSAADASPAADAGRSPIFADFGWSAFLRVAGMLAGLVAIASAARLLSRGDFGAFAIAAGIVTVGSIVARLGLSRAVVSIVASALARGEGARAHGSIVVCIRVVAFASVILAGILASPVGTWIAEGLFSSEHLQQVMWLVAVWMAAEAVRLVMSEAFRGMHDIRTAMLLGDTGRSLIVGAAFLAMGLTINSTSLRVAVGASLGASVLVGAVAGVVLQGKLRRLPRVRSVSPATVLGVGLPMLAAELSGFLVTQGDVWVVGVLRSGADVAVYSAASIVALSLALPLYVVNSVLAPRLARLNALGRIDDMQRLVRSTATFATAPSLLAFVVLLFGGRTILSVAFGADDFGRAHVALAVLAAGVVFGVATGSSALALMMTGHHRIVGFVAAWVLVVTLAAEVIGAHYGGLPGVAVASACGTVLQNLVLVVFARRRLGIWTIVTLRPTWPLPE